MSLHDRAWRLQRIAIRNNFAGLAEWLEAECNYYLTNKIPEKTFVSLLDQAEREMKGRGVDLASEGADFEGDGW